MALGWVEISLLMASAALIVGGSLSSFRSYRSLLWGGAVLVFITALFPRAGNNFGQYLFAAAPIGLHLPVQLFGLAWWILGAWLVKSVLELVLLKTVFPHDNQPHARRLFADLASGFVYVVAFVGIMETVLKQPISGILATSGVLAIVLGLALQNTLADVFSGLAINIEHPFRAGDWITLTGGVEGEVMEINWRATRIRSAANDLVVVPNSVIAKIIVTNHRPLNNAHVATIDIEIDHRIPPERVINTLQTAAAGVVGIASETPPAAYACRFSDTTIAYQLCFGVVQFTALPDVQSAVILRVTNAFQAEGIPIGSPPTDVRMVAESPATHNVGRPMAIQSTVAQPKRVG
jgi:small-conductance mechanosensitive channel